MRAEINPLQPGLFPAHGEVLIDWSNGLLFVQARGPFNAEFMQRSTDAITELSRRAGSQPVQVELVHWIDSMLMPPEGWARFEAAVQRFVDAGLNGHTTLCVAAPEVEARWLMLPRMVAVWERSRRVEVFEALRPAQQRARELLARP